VLSGGYHTNGGENTDIFSAIIDSRDGYRASRSWMKRPDAVARETRFLAIRLRNLRDWQIGSNAIIIPKWTPNGRL
jgi:hypothetical protein